METLCNRLHQVFKYIREKIRDTKRDYKTEIALSDDIQQNIAGNDQEDEEARQMLEAEMDQEKL